MSHQLVASRRDPVAVAPVDESMAAAPGAGDPDVDVQTFSAEEARGAIKEFLEGADRGDMTLDSVRQMVAERIGLSAEGLESRADDVNALITECFCAKQAILHADQPEGPQQRMARIVDELGQERDTPRQTGYLVTISRVLPDVALASDLADISAMQSQQIGGSG